MNIELIRLKKKLSIMEIDGSNQVFMDLLKMSKNPIISINEKLINKLKNHYKFEIEYLEDQQKEIKYKQGQLL